MVTRHGPAESERTHWGDCWKVHEACEVARRTLAARPCTCHLCPPGIGCAPCWARETLERTDG